MRTAQLASLLTLDETCAVRLLKTLLTSRGPAQDIVFDEKHNTAYAGTAERVDVGGVQVRSDTEQPDRTPPPARGHHGVRADLDGAMRAVPNLRVSSG